MTCSKRNVPPLNKRKIIRLHSPLKSRNESCERWTGTSFRSCLFYISCPSLTEATVTLPQYYCLCIYFSLLTLRSGQCQSCWTRERSPSLRNTVQHSCHVIFHPLFIAGSSEQCHPQAYQTIHLDLVDDVFLGTSYVCLVQSTLL